MWRAGTLSVFLGLFGCVMAFTPPILLHTGAVQKPCTHCRSPSLALLAMKSDQSSAETRLRTRRVVIEGVAAVALGSLVLGPGSSHAEATKAMYATLRADIVNLVKAEPDWVRELADVCALLAVSFLPFRPVCLLHSPGPNAGAPGMALKWYV